MHVPLLMPDLDLPPQQVMAVSCWLVPLDREVLEGDRLVEISAGEVLVDLSAPATGKLVQRAVAEGDEVVANQTLGIVQTE